MVKVYLYRLKASNDSPSGPERYCKSKGPFRAMGHANLQIHMEHSQISETAGKRTRYSVLDSDVNVTYFPSQQIQ
jgi:hypothetical protein